MERNLLHVTYSGRVSMHRHENQWIGMCSIPISDITNAEVIKMPTDTLHFLLGTVCNKTNIPILDEVIDCTQYSKLVGVITYVLSGLSISLDIIMKSGLQP